MYGIVNKAIEDLVRINHGQEVWEAIKEKSQIDVDFFISNEPYPDEITYKLAVAAAEELNITVDEMLISFGEFWVLYTGKEKYGSLMEAGGANLREFLLNLPNFHNRIMLIYPNLTPPEFRVSHLTENSVHVHYFSQRQGLKEFVRGLLLGLGKLYQTKVAVELLQDRDDGADHEIFKVNW